MRDCRAVPGAGWISSVPLLLLALGLISGCASTLAVEEQCVNVIGDLAERPPSLGAGYRIEAAIVDWSGKDVVTVPTSAIFRRDAQRHVFVVDASVARLRRIAIGRQSAEHAQVVRCLAGGERVILFPSDLIDDGVKVSVPQKEKAAS